MKKKQCRAVNKKTGKQCEQTVRWGRKYCWRHYPKTRPILTLILGALLGFIITLLLNNPLESFLSCLWPFHYLDREAPTIVSITPDIRTTKYIDSNSLTFSASFRDDCSGVDLDNCSISLYYLKDSEYELLSPEVIYNANSLNLILDKILKHGEYKIEIKAFDKARNTSESEFTFVVSEENILNMLVFYDDYNDTKPQHKNLFRNFNLKEHIKNSGRIKKTFYVYKYAISNDSEETYCRNLYFNISNQANIYCWEELSGYKSHDIIFENTTHAIQKNIPQDMFFSSERILNIEEIGPGGFVQIAALVGFPHFNNESPEERIPRKIDIHGTYVSESYGITKIEDVRKEIPVTKSGLP